MLPLEPLAGAEDEMDAEVYDKYIGVMVILDNIPNCGGNVATVKSRVTDINLVCTLAPYVCEQ